MSSTRKKAGHRSWAAKNKPLQGGNRGDIMSAEKRSALMSRIRGKNTGPERKLFEILKSRNLDFECHPNDISGRPDIVFREIRVAVFVDGDFWHGWRFPLWEGKLTEKWRDKIQGNRDRDQRNFRKLRRLGWSVIRIWEHQIEQNLLKCLTRIEKVYQSAQKSRL